MKDIIRDHKEFICSCTAVLLGTAVGFAGARFITSALNDRVLETCSSAKIISAQDPLIGERLFCIKK